MMPALRSVQHAVETPPAPICLALQKYSFVVVARNSFGRLPWTHTSTNGNLYAVFDYTSTLRGESKVYCKRMKIIQDPDVLVEEPLFTVCSLTELTAL
jgi:hypothetical protein